MERIKQSAEFFDKIFLKDAGPAQEVKPPLIRETVYAPPSGVIRDPNTKKIREWSVSKTDSIPSYDNKKPDTLRKTIYKKPTE